MSLNSEQIECQLIWNLAIPILGIDKPWMMPNKQYCEITVGSQAAIV
jgi:hypothetical protein